MTVEEAPPRSGPDRKRDTMARLENDTRESTPAYGYVLVTPQRVRAWREENELDSREIMRDGRWLV